MTDRKDLMQTPLKYSPISTQVIAARQEVFFVIHFLNCYNLEDMKKIDLPQLSLLPWLNIFNQTIDRPENLPLLLAEHGVDGDCLSNFADSAASPSEPYGRKILFKDGQIEVMLASWSYKSSAAPHNHGSSKGLIWFAHGRFSEQHFRFRDRNLQKINPAILFSENEVVAVDANDIHSCCPESTGLSLHIYSPPINEMKVWDEAQKLTLTVSDECGAWIPKDRDLILEEHPW